MRLIKVRLSLSALTVLLFFVTNPGWASSLDTIIIDRGVDEPIRIAVVPFRSNVALSSITS